MNYNIAISNTQVLKNAIVWGETRLAINCMEYLLKHAWSIKAIVTNDSNVINWCKENHIPSFSIDQASMLPKQCYLFSIINPYVISSKLLSDLKPIRAINYHDSLLPKYAGLNSTTWSILNDEKFHGISWHEITVGIDEGDIYYQTKISINHNDTAFSLNLKCVEAALIGFTRLIDDIAQNKLIGKIQDLSGKTYFGRNHIPDNYAILNPNNDLSYINNLLNSLSFGSGYLNPVATVKVKLDKKYYILEKKLQQNAITHIDQTSCVFRNLYGKNEESVDFEQIEPCVLSHEDISNLQKLKQQEFSIYNNLSSRLPVLEIQSRLFSSRRFSFSQTHACGKRKSTQLEINAHITTETLCIFLSIILNKLNSDNTFIKIYHNNLNSDQKRLLEDITEQISILTINSEDLDLSYGEISKKITTEINQNKFHISKDFGYRYNLNLCSEFAIMDNYQGMIDEHATVFSIHQNKVTVSFYETDSNFIKMLIKTIDVLFTAYNATKYFDIQVKNIELLSKEDYQKIVYDWNRTEKNYPDNKTIHELFEENVTKTPDNIAVIYEDIRLTYKELNERSNKIANYLRETYQIIGDDLIALCLDRSEHMLIVILATLKSGAAYVPIDPTYPTDRIKYILEDTKVKVVLTNEKHTGIPAQAGIHSTCMICPIDNTEFQNKIKPYSSENLSLNITSTNLAYVIYTSGTTGTPKGVLQQHNNVMRLLYATDDLYKFNAQDIWTLFHSYVFDFSVWEIFGALCYGGKLIVPKLETTRDTRIFYNFCDQHQITILNQTPTAFYQFMDEALSRSSKDKLNNLRHIILGGELLNYPQLRPWFNLYGYNKPFLTNMYGITEITVHATYKQITELDIKQNSCIGRHLPDQTSYILNSNLEVLPVGAIGMLYIGGAGIARGYLNHPELTIDRFIANPFQTNAEKQQNQNERLYKTGDLACYLPNGNLEYVGRNDSQIKIRGYRIELGEIENTLITYPEIKQAVVCLITDDIINRDSIGGRELTHTNEDIGIESKKYLVAYYIAVNTIDKELLQQYLANKLPEYIVPSAFVQLDKFPLTTNGKLDKKSLPTPEFRQSIYVAPRNDLEAKACKIFAEILGLTRTKIGVTDDFFKLGGDSILSIRLVSKLRVIGINVDIRNLYGARTVKNLLLNSNPIIGEDIIYVPFSLIDKETKDRVISEEKNAIIEDIFPATYLQIGMLLEYEKNKSYHIVTSYKIKLPLNPDKINATFHNLIMSNGMLRCSCKEDKKYVLLIIQHKEVNLRAKIRFAQDDIDELINNEINTPINKYEPGLFRITISNDSDGFNLILTTNHITEDGWSVASLISEFIDLYSGNLHQIFHIPPYAKYVAKELAILSNTEYINFWQNYMADIEINNSNLIFDKKSISAEPLIVVKKHLASVMGKKLLEISQELHITPDIIFLAIYSLTLSRFLNNNEVLIGTVVNNRLEEDGGDKVFGLHLNTIPIRFKIHKNTFADVKTYIMDCYQEKLKVAEYKLYPYGKLKSDLKMFEDIYSCAFSYVHFHIMSDKLQKNILEVTSEYQRTNIPFLLNISRCENQFDISLEAKNTFIDINTSNKFFKYFNYYIECLIETNKLEPLIPAELKLISSWNQTRKEYPDDKTIHQLFEEQVDKTPNNIAVIYKEIKLTYKELNERSNQLANYIRETYKIIGDDLIALCLDRSEHVLIAILAILKSGAAYVPIDPNYPEERIKYILEDTKTKVVLTNNIYQDKLNTITTISIRGIDNAKFQSSLKQYSSDNHIQNITSKNLAYVIYTSGTTGKPKGVMVEHLQVTSFIQGFKDKLFGQEFLQQSSLNTLSTTNYTFDIFGLEYLLPLTNSSSVTLTSIENLNKTSNTILNKYNFVQLTPSKIDLFFSQVVVNKTNHSHKLILFIGGEALTKNHLKLIQKYQEKNNNIKIDVINSYGPTESTIWSTMYLIDDSERIHVGKPLPNEMTYVLNRNLEILPVGAIGELYIGGAGVARGYLNQPLLTKERFIHNPFQTAAEKQKSQNNRLYKTGDLVRYISDGNLEYIGRSDFQVKINGFRIELGEIENALNSYVGIKQSVVIPYHNTDSNKYLVAYYIADTELKENEIFTYLENILPGYMIPHVIIQLEDLPLTSNGKLDRNALPIPEILARDTYIAPSNFAELKSCTFYAEVLNLPDNSVGINHDFFKLGGNSILAINLLYKLQQEFKIDLNDIFKLRTPARIAKLASFTKNSLYHRLKLMKTIYDKLESYPITPEMEKKQSAYLKQALQIKFTNKLKDIKVVLLTGSTGHLGCHILYQLLFETKYKIYLLIRASSNKEAYTRIDNKFQFYFNQSLDRYQDRIIPLAADIEKENLGLDNGQYKTLVNHVDSVIHSAALVKHYGDYTTFHDANVQATINLLQLTMLTHLKDFHYISTISVLKTGYIPNSHYHLFTEADNGLELKKNNIYVRTKHEGELAAISYREFGVNSNIYRVGNLAMNAKTYKSQENIEENAFFTKVKTIIDVGMITNEISQVEISPVDSTALAIARIFAQVELSNQTYHVANSHLCDLSQLFTQHKNIKIKNVEFEDFIEALLIRLNNKINRQQVESFMLHQGWLEDVNLQDLIQIVVLQDKTDMILSKLNFSWPSIKPQMISDVITRSFSGDKKMQKKEPIFEYVESIAELIPASLSWLDLEGKCVGLNTLLLNGIGALKKDDIIGKNTYEIYKDKDVTIANEIYKINETVLQTGKTSQTEDKIIDITTGKIKYYSATRAPLRNKRGEIIGLVNTAIEITAQKEAERLKFENEVTKATLAEKEKLIAQKEVEELRLKAATVEAKLEVLQAQTAAKEQEKFKKAVEQMMHDITSPISSINTIISKLGRNVAETDRVTLRHAAERIEGISQKLLNQYNKSDNNDDAPENLLVSIALLQILNEKREEHLESGVHFETDIDDDARFCFIKHNSGMFKRMMSNLINNAVDALQNVQKSKITITLTVSPKSAIITVEDNGPGMPQHIQDKFNQGIAVTEGKKDGHGIGLTQVFDAINFGSGRCEIYASKNGTQICIYFPKVEVPQWIATEVKLTRDDTVIILDDDESIHGAWDNKFEAIRSKIPTLQIQHFTHGKEVIQHINNLTEEQKENTYLLTDYELLDQEMNGLDVVEQTKMKRATLVTSYATQKKIQDRVSGLGIRMLPKELVSAVKINVDKKIVKGSRIVDMVWLEDQKYFVNNLIEKYYNHLKVDVYYDPISFMEDIIQYPTDTRIILDTYYNADDVDKTPYMQTGYDLAKELHALGFTKLILFSGEDPKGRAPEYLQVLSKKEAYDTENLDKI